MKSPCCKKTIYRQLAIPGTNAEYLFCGKCGKTVKGKRSDIVPELADPEMEFLVKKGCPYCGADAKAVCDGFEQDDQGNWKSDGSFSWDYDCEPDIDSDDWDAWYSTHSHSPYIYVMPVAQMLKNTINERYNFNL